MNKKEKTPLGSILIVSEDTKSSRFYIESKIATLQLRKQTYIEIYVGGEIAGKDKKKSRDPKSAAEFAIKQLQDLNKTLNEEEKAPITQVFCVVDVDNHDADANNPHKNKVRDCVQICQGNSNSNIEFVPIISNECFEAWYILHFKNSGDSKPISRPMSRGKSKKTRKFIADDERTDKLLEKYLGSAYAKNETDIYTVLQNANADETQAIANAKWLEDYHRKNQNVLMEPYYFANPSTNVYRLVERLTEINLQIYPPPVSEITKDDIKNNRFLEDYIAELVILINMHFENASKKQKIDLVQGILNNPYNNKACIDFRTEIAAYVNENHEHFKF
jgi:hypothetical protein